MNRDVFRQFSLFSELDDLQLDKIASIAKPRKYSKDEVVFHADESGDVFCLILTGKVKVTMISPEGKEIILTMLGPGEFFGEMALLDDEPRSATIVAMKPLEILTIWRTDFLQMLADDFSIAARILAEMSRRLRTASLRIESLATMDVYGRLARYFLDLAQKDGEDQGDGYVSVVRPTHQSIANIIGTSRETVSRLLHELTERKLLESRGKTIFIRKEALDQVDSSAN